MAALKKKGWIQICITSLFNNDLHQREKKKKKTWVVTGEDVRIEDKRKKKGGEKRDGLSVEKQ